MPVGGACCAGVQLHDRRSRLSPHLLSALSRYTRVYVELLCAASAMCFSTSASSGLSLLAHLALQFSGDVWTCANWRDSGRPYLFSVLSAASCPPSLSPSLSLPRRALQGPQVILRRLLRASDRGSLSVGPDSRLLAGIGCWAAFTPAVISFDEVSLLTLLHHKRSVTLRSWLPGH